MPYKSIKWYFCESWVVCEVSLISDSNSIKIVRLSLVGLFPMSLYRDIGVKVLTNI